MTQKTSQTDRVLARLRAAPLTQMEALTELGVMRLGARILELRDSGYEIQTEIVEVPTRISGETARVARYRLLECVDGHDPVPLGDGWGSTKCARCGVITCPPPSFTLAQPEGRA